MDQPYNDYGCMGKHSRDHIHVEVVATIIGVVAAAPRSGERYKLDGGSGKSCSTIEAFDRVEQLSYLKMVRPYVDATRERDHACYISDLPKLRPHYAYLLPRKSLDDISSEIVRGWSER